MPRRVKSSVKQKKQKLQEKRASKRGESPPPSKLTAKERAKIRGNGRMQRSTQADGTSTRLQSRFIALTPDYLQKTRDLAYATVLDRPIPADFAVFPVDSLQRDADKLVCPERPKFRYDQTKKEVERNEEGLFKKWLKNTEEVVTTWVQGGEDEAWPRSPTWFETNLEVWRQLWRVTESSSILLLLLDSRCPPLHCPPSLKTYVQNLKGQKQVVLVLTKADLVEPAALEGWKEWAKQWWERPVEVVSVMSYDLDFLRESGRHRPDIPVQSLQALLDALKRAHERLLQPPERIRDDPEKVSKWSPNVRATVDWQALARDTKDADDHDQETDARSEGREEPLTIGLIGQPNVGKSSLLNALLGEQRVRASKTPGKTKHFQTMFWGEKKEVKMVDCPGLVCPSLVGLEIQALCGILPISQIPSLPACIYQSGRIIPLEEIFRIPEPEVEEEDPYASKKTWRGPREAISGEQKVKWTAGELMERRALDRGFLTAKSGRPDGNRAANGIMRTLADGRVRWGYWPPGVDVSSREGLGIYLPGKEGELNEEDKAEPSGERDGEHGGEQSSRSEDEDGEGESEWEEDFDSEAEPHDEELDEEDEDDRGEEGGETEDEEEGEEEVEAKPRGKSGGFFAALEEDEEEGEGDDDDNGQGEDEDEDQH